MPSPASRCGRSLVSGRPRQCRVPVSGCTKPQATLNRVVLPAPFGPITPSTWLGATSRETSESAVIPLKLTEMSAIAKPAAASPSRVVVGLLRLNGDSCRRV